MNVSIKNRFDHLRLRSVAEFDAHEHFPWLTVSWLRLRVTGNDLHENMVQIIDSSRCSSTDLTDGTRQLVFQLINRLIRFASPASNRHVLQCCLRSSRMQFNQLQSDIDLLRLSHARPHFSRCLEVFSCPIPTTADRNE